MIALIEGPDGAGKTTLTHVLGWVGREYDLRVRHVHNKGPETGDSYDKYRRIIDSGYQDDELLVVDRMHLAEMVYGTTRRMAPSFGLGSFFELTRGVWDAPGQIVVLTPGVAICRDRILMRGERPPGTLWSEHERHRHLADLVASTYPYVITHVDEMVRPSELTVVARNLVKNLIERTGTECI